MSLACCVLFIVVQAFKGYPVSLGLRRLDLQVQVIILPTPCFRAKWIPGDSLFEAAVVTWLM